MANIQKAHGPAYRKIYLKFREYLNEKGIVATVRRELGSDIDAACGQLRKKEVERCESMQKQI